jgi:hypothetical protein
MRHVSTNWAEVTGLGTVAVAAVAVGVAVLGEWRAGARVRSERQHAAKVLAAQQEHSDEQLRLEREAADSRLKSQQEHSDQQVREERRASQDSLQLAEAYTVRVSTGWQDGRIVDPHINANPEDVLQSMVIVVINRGRFTVTEVEARLFRVDNSQTAPAKTERIAEMPPTGDQTQWIDGPLKDLGNRTLAPWSGGLRFIGSATVDHRLAGAYPMVRWTDRWGQRWEHSKGRVRRTEERATTWTAWP